MVLQLPIGRSMRSGSRRSVRGTGMRLAGLLLVAVALGTPARAQSLRVQDPAPLNNAFDSALKSWMPAHQIPAVSLAAMKDGRIVTTLGYGGMNASGPARIASLSKAI